MSKVSIVPGEFPHMFAGQNKQGVRYEITFWLSDEAHLNNEKSLATVKKVLDGVYAEMRAELSDRLASRTKFLDELLAAKQSIGAGKLTQATVAEKIGINERNLKRALDKHFANIPSKYNQRFKAAMEACETEPRGKLFYG